MQKEMVLPETFDEADNYCNRIWLHLRHANFDNFVARDVISNCRTLILDAWKTKIETGDYSGKI